MTKRDATKHVAAAWAADDHAEPIGVDAMRSVLQTQWPELYQALQELAPVDHEPVETAEDFADRVSDELSTHRAEVLGG